MLLGWVIKSELFTGFSVRDFTEEKKGVSVYMQWNWRFFSFFMPNTVFDYSCLEQCKLHMAKHISTNDIKFWKTIIPHMRQFLSVFKHLNSQLYRQCTPCGFRSTIKRRDSQWVSNSRKFLSILLFLFYSRRKKIVSPKNSWWSSQNNVNSGPRKWLINKIDGKETRYLRYQVCLGL